MFGILGWVSYINWEGQSWKDDVLSYNYDRTSLTALLHYCNPYMSRSIRAMREKIINMDYELVVDAIAKVRQVQHLRSRYSKAPAYHIGELVYLIRTKYAQMLRIYFRCVGGVEGMTHNALISELIRIQKLSMDINHSQEAMTEYLEKHYKPKKLNNNTKLEDLNLENTDLDKIDMNKLEKADLENLDLNNLNEDEISRYKKEARKMLGQLVYSRNERLDKAYPMRKSHLKLDVFEGLRFFDKNWTDLLIQNEPDHKNIDFDQYYEELFFL